MTRLVPCSRVSNGSPTTLSFEEASWWRRRLSRKGLLGSANLLAPEAGSSSMLAVYPAWLKNGDMKNGDTRIFAGEAGKIGKGARSFHAGGYIASEPVIFDAFSSDMHSHPIIASL